LDGNEVEGEEDLEEEDFVPSVVDEDDDYRDS